jgi:hypothetical protein
MHVLKGEAGHRKSAASSGKLWHALHAISDYLTGQSHWLANYAKRYRVGLGVGNQSPRHPQSSPHFAGSA